MTRRTAILLGLVFVLLACGTSAASHGRPESVLKNVRVGDQRKSKFSEWMRCGAIPRDSQPALMLSIITWGPQMKT